MNISRRVAKIAYTNTTPFFFNWPESKFPTVGGTPRELADWTREGSLIAGPLPVVETWKMENEFEPLGPYGISVQDQSRSVFLLSRKEMKDLNHSFISLTQDSYTSVALLKTLLSQKYEIEVTMNRGFHKDADATLVIGDEALRYWKTESTEWPYIIDLATEWWDWKHLPFVFAQWVVRKDLDLSIRKELVETVEQCLEKGIAAIPEISKIESNRIHVNQDKITQYLQGFLYRFGVEQEKSLKEFRRLLQHDSQTLNVAGSKG